MKAHRMNVGDRLRIFDYFAWGIAGGDVGDNDCFFREATVVKAYDIDGEETVDVRFDHRVGTVSNGHFVKGQKTMTGKRIS